MPRPNGPGEAALLLIFGPLSVAAIEFTALVVGGILMNSYILLGGVQ